MTQTGMVRSIAGPDLLVEPFRGDAAADNFHCGSGGCENCGKRGKTRLIKVGNPRGLEVTGGDLVRFEVPSVLAFFAAIRILVLPPALFAALYYFLRGSAGLIAGGAAAAGAMAVNILFRKKTSDREKPTLVGVL